MSDSTLHFPNLWKNPLHPSLVVEPLREKEEGVSGSLQEAVQNNQSSPPPSASPATPPLSFLHTGKGPPPQGLCCPWFLLSFRFSPTSPVPNCFSDLPDLRESPPAPPLRHHLPLPETALPMCSFLHCSSLHLRLHERLPNWLPQKETQPWKANTIQWGCSLGRQQWVINNSAWLNFHASPDAVYGELSPEGLRVRNAWDACSICPRHSAFVSIYPSLMQANPIPNEHGYLLLCFMCVWFSIVTLI